MAAGFLIVRVRCAVVVGVVVRAIDVDAGVRLERCEANHHHVGVDGPVSVLVALTKTVQAFSKPCHQWNSDVFVLLLVTRGYLDVHISCSTLAFRNTAWRFSFRIFQSNSTAVASAMRCPFHVRCPTNYLYCRGVNFRARDGDAFAWDGHCCGSRIITGITESGKGFLTDPPGQGRQVFLLLYGGRFKWVYKKMHCQHCR